VACAGRPLTGTAAITVGGVWCVGGNQLHHGWYLVGFCLKIDNHSLMLNYAGNACDAGNLVIGPHLYPAPLPQTNVLSCLLCQLWKEGLYGESVDPFMYSSSTGDAELGSTA